MPTPAERPRARRAYTDPAHGVNHLRRELIVYLTPQMADVDVHNIRETVVVHCPRRVPLFMVG